MVEGNGRAPVTLLNTTAAARGIATRFDNLATVYRAAVLLHDVITWTQALSDTH